MSGTIYTKQSTSRRTHAQDKTEGKHRSWLPGKQTTLRPVPSDQGTRSSKTQAMLSLWPGMCQKTCHLPYATTPASYYSQACLERCNSKTLVERWPRQPDSLSKHCL